MFYGTKSVEGEAGKEQNQVWAMQGTGRGWSRRAAQAFAESAEVLSLATVEATPNGSNGSEELARRVGGGLFRCLFSRTAV